MSFGYVSFGILSLGLMSFGAMSFGLLSVYPFFCLELEPVFPIDLFYGS